MEILYFLSIISIFGIANRQWGGRILGKILPLKSSNPEAVLGVLLGIFAVAWAFGSFDVLTAFVLSASCAISFLAFRGITGPGLGILSSDGYHMFFTDGKDQERGGFASAITSMLLPNWDKPGLSETTYLAGGILFHAIRTIPAVLILGATIGCFFSISLIPLALIALLHGFAYLLIWWFDEAILAEIFSGAIFGLPIALAIVLV